MRLRRARVIAAYKELLSICAPNSFGQTMCHRATRSCLSGGSLTRTCPKNILIQMASLEDYKGCKLWLLWQFVLLQFTAAVTDLLLSLYNEPSQRRAAPAALTLFYPMTVAHQAPLPVDSYARMLGVMVAFLLVDLLYSGIKSVSPALQDSLPLEPSGEAPQPEMKE